MTREEFEKRAASGPNCGLYRAALTSGHVDWKFPCSRTGMWSVLPIEDRAEQLYAYLLESLVTALEHTDRTLATRAAFQAKGYIERLGAMHAFCGGPACHDACRAAIERVCAWVKAGEVCEDTCRQIEQKLKDAH